MVKNPKKINVVTIQREGEEPQFFKFQTMQDYERKIVEVLKILPKKQSTAVIAKNIGQANELEQILLAGKVKFESFTYSTTSVPSSGIYLLPISVAKGLEFDNVILHNVSEENFRSERDRLLLYTGISRSMKRLFLPYLHQCSYFFE